MEKKNNLLIAFRFKNVCNYTKNFSYGTMKKIKLKKNYETFKQQWISVAFEKKKNIDLN